MTALNKALRRSVPLVLIAILFVYQIAIRLRSDLIYDAAWFLYVAQGLLDGGELYRDFVEVNPPLAIWLTVPVVILSRVTGLAPVETFYGMFFATTAVSLLLVRRYLAMIRGVPDWAPGLVLVLLAAAFLFIPGRSFGQREHLLVLLFMPWFVLRFARSQGTQISATESILVGLLAAVAICLKPHAVLAPLAVEALLLLRSRNLRAVFAPENLAAAIFVVIYGFAVVIWCPRFLSEMVGFGIAAYIPYYGTDAASILKRSTQSVSVLVFALVLQRMANGPMRELSGLALVATAGFLASYFLQAKGYFYQIMPVQIFGAAGGIFALAGVFGGNNADEPKKSLRVPALVAFILVLLSLMPQTYRNRATVFTAAISQYRPGAKSVFIASTNVHNGFPLAVRENLIWGSRFPALWLIPYVSYRWHDGPLPDDPIIAYALDATVTDLQTLRPEVVFINQSTSQDYIRNGTFDYLKFMSQDPKFAAIWSNYELRGQAGNFAVYVTKGP